MCKNAWTVNVLIISSSHSTESKRLPNPKTDWKHFRLEFRLAQYQTWILMIFISMLVSFWRLHIHVSHLTLVLPNVLLCCTDDGQTQDAAPGVIQDVVLLPVLVSQFSVIFEPPVDHKYLTVANSHTLLSSCSFLICVPDPWQRCSKGWAGELYIFSFYHAGTLQTAHESGWSWTDFSKKIFKKIYIW